jgi:phage terminase large subunit-like protein
MAQLRRVLVHENGPTLWPEHKPPAEVYDLRDTTPDYIWQTTWLGRRVAAGGSTYHREWWAEGRNRYDPTDARLYDTAVARFISWDTASKKSDAAAYSACVVGDLLPDYRLAIRYAERAHLELHELVGAVGRNGYVEGAVERVAKRFYVVRPNGETVLRNVVIEDKSSGIGAVQTIRANAETWLASIVEAFDPKIGDKEHRGRLAAVWCAQACILLPHPDPSVPWLQQFENDLYAAPNATHMDYPDAFAQLILWVENLLAAGLAARRASAGEYAEGVIR